MLSQEQNQPPTSLSLPKNRAWPPPPRSAPSGHLRRHGGHLQILLVRWACHRLQRQRRLHAYILPQRSHTHEACSHGRRACAASPALLGRMALLLTVWTSHILLLLLQDK
uniref:Uncharacterized protein n=1 Tax=Aegilops tauschii subsp. strangulata TaxID=200361 RepID=A0A453G7X0_AEGTS